MQELNSNDSYNPFPDHLLAIKAADVSVSYRAYSKRPTTLKESFLNAVKTGNLKYYNTFEAVSKLNFDIKKGEVFGIVGSNGSGKSSLLKVLSGVLMPTAGQVTLNGSVDSLIELGAGFDPELNAIENIYLHSSLYKRKRSDTAKRIEKIIDFAELGDFVYSPIKYYSSGMFARLGFSVAVDSNPDILLIDEVLGVGDERFQTKCFALFRDLIAQGKTIVIVSHALEQLKGMCDRMMLLSKGKQIYIGDPDKTVDIYRSKEYLPSLSATEH